MSDSRRAIPVVAAVVVALAATSAILMRATSANQGVGDTIGADNLDPDTNPFYRGQDVKTPTAAEEAVGFAIPRPNDSLASDSQITHLWIEPGYHQVRIWYSSELYVQENPNATTSNLDSASLQKKFEEFAKEAADVSGGKAQVTKVNGDPAYLVPDGAFTWSDGTSQGAPGAVELVVGGIDVVVVGHLSNDDLLRIASTIR